MRPFTLFLIAGCGFAADLFRDDFSRFPPGLLSQPMGQLNGAIQEYHYIEHRGVRTHPWRNPIVHLDSWAVSDEDGKPYIEQHLVNADTGRTTPLFVTGDEGAAGATAGRRRSGRRNGDRSPVRLSFTTRSVRVKGRRGTIRSPSTRIVTASRSLWQNGKAVWSHDMVLHDHPDGISAGSYGADPNAPPRFHICGSDAKHVKIGHAQTQSVGKCMPRCQSGRDSRDEIVVWDQPGACIAARLGVPPGFGSLISTLNRSPARSIDSSGNAFADSSNEWPPPIRCCARPGFMVS